jgi:hypothetical protein
MLRPRIALGNQFTVLVLAVKIAAWLVSIVSCMIVTLFRFGATRARPAGIRRRGQLRKRSA